MTGEDFIARCRNESLPMMTHRRSSLTSNNYSLFRDLAVSIFIQNKCSIIKLLFMSHYL